MRDLLLQLVVLQRNSRNIATIQAPESARNGTVTERNPAPVTKARENIPENDLDGCLSVLLSCLRGKNSVLAVNAAILDYMSSLLSFDCAETAARVRSVSDAQNLIDFIDLLTNNESFLDLFGPDARCKAAYLASEIFARVPVIPWSYFWNGPNHQYHSDGPSRFMPRALESGCQTALIGRILDHNYTVPLLREYYLRFVGGNVNERNETFRGWPGRSNPFLVTKIRAVSCNDHLRNLVHGFVVDAQGSENHPIHPFHGHRTVLHEYPIKTLRFGLESPCKGSV
ncbi:hypothetical protein M378DRAFT_395817 [Amanita muscaria Koide BX008]|uniref:Uncharacterized protein n=1 Tax=Amanita muscaria (strain Koide BX008) TaxID=946122 RepID=A0A0C2WM99_AMAMK|nr:hypothetical protein M378DRAFT_395817 [Amanita muscaria Koide BX008]